MVLRSFGGNDKTLRRKHTIRRFRDTQQPAAISIDPHSRPRLCIDRLQLRETQTLAVQESPRRLGIELD